MAVLLAGLPHGRRVDDGHQLVQVVDQHAVEQVDVAIEQADQVAVLGQRRGQAAHVFQHARGLLFQRGHARRQQAAQAQRVALGLAEAGALVEQGVVQQIGAARVEL